MLLNHVGICVTDVERSIHFYRDCLGLSVFQDQIVSGPDIDAYCDVKDGKFRMVLLTDKAGNAIELWGWLSPIPAPVPPEHRQFTSVGIIEVGLQVRDLNMVEKRLSENGYAFKTPLLEFGKGKGWFGGSYAQIRYVSDPDGVPVELIQWVPDETS